MKQAPEDVDQNSGRRNGARCRAKLDLVRSARFTLCTVVLYPSGENVALFNACLEKNKPSRSYEFYWT